MLYIITLYIIICVYSIYNGINNMYIIYIYIRIYIKNQVQNSSKFKVVSSH